MAEQYKSGVNRFALGVSVVALVVGSGMAWLRYSDGDPAWIFALPVVFTPMTYMFLTRRREERILPMTTRGYTMHVEKFQDGAISRLVERVVQHGYQLDVADLKKPGAPAPLGDAKLGNCEIRLREHRAPVEYGDLTIRLTVHQNGGMLGYIEASDTQPGFYDELAQYVVAELGDIVGDAEFSHSATHERRPVTALRPELPKSPYGLGLLLSE